MASREPAWTPPIDGIAGPKYLAIVEALAAAIGSGQLAVGDRLPPQRALAEALGLDLTTVTRAFTEARRRGLVEAQTGRGTFVRARPRQAPPMRTPLLDLRLNLPPQPPSAQLPQRIAAGIAALMAAPDAAAQLQYHESGGLAAHRATAARYLAARLGPLAAERVLIASGAQNALAALLDLLLHPGDVIATGVTTYPGVKAIAMQRGFHLQPLAMDEEGIEPEAFQALCRSFAPKLLYCVPAIDSPTTATMSAARRRDIAAIADRNGVLLVEDDAYGALPHAKLPSLVSLLPSRTWHVASLSKCATPALRIACVVAPDAVQADHLSAVLRATSLMPPPLMAALAASWMDSGTLDQITDAIRSENVARQAIVRRALDGIPYAACAEGHHLWLQLPPFWRRAEFVAQALQSGLSVVPSDAFAVGPDAPEAVRISIGAVPDRTLLETAFERLSALLRGQRPAAAIV
jgi:DNA-binding transcriptional MocR family regulator